MLRLLSLGGVAVLVSLAITSLAFGAVPSPANCTVPAKIVGCPAGDVATQITVRDASNNAIQGAIVVIDLTLAAAQGPNGAPAVPCLQFCAGQSQSPSAVTNASGVATFNLKVGGCCARNYQVWVGAVNIGTITNVASLDISGNLSVGLEDFIYFQGVYNVSADPCADFDLSGGLVALGDFIYFQTHYNQVCL